MEISRNFVKTAADRVLNAVVAPGTPLPQGPDLNQYRVITNGDDVKPVDFGISKFTQGDWEDIYLEKNVDELAKATDIQGGYFYDDLRYSPEINVRTFIDTVRKLEAKGKPMQCVAGDWEPYNRNATLRHLITPKRVIGQLHTLREEFPELPILAYMNLDVLKHQLQYDQRLQNFLLWFASPYSLSMPQLPNGFEVFMWQQSWVKVWPGFENFVWALDTVDWNIVNMSRPEFRKLMLPNTSPPPVDPPPGVQIVHRLPDVMSVMTEPDEDGNQLTGTFVRNGS